MSILRVEEITKLDGSPFFPDLSPFVLKTQTLTGSVAYADSGFLHLVYDAEIVYLPSGTEGSRVAFADLRGEFAIKPITILPADGSGNTLADQASVSLDETNQAVGFIFSENNWVPIWDYGSFGAGNGGSLEPLRVTDSSVNAQPGILYLLDGTTQVVLPSGNNGDRIALADYANRFGQLGFNVTVLAQGGQTILGQSTYVLQEDGQVLDLVFWGDRWVLVNPDINRLLRDGANLVEGFTFPNDGLRIRDSVETETLTLSVGDNLSQNRVLTLETNDQDVTLTVSASADISGTNTGDQAISLVGDVTGGPSQGEITTTISDSAVTLAKLADIQSARLLGRISAGTGPVQELTYQQVANALSGTDVGDLVELEDVGGGVAGLPAVDASQLLNVPAGVPNVTVQDEGVAVTTALESLNVIGNFIEVSAVGNDVTLTSTAGDALTSQGLGQFASTTSAELATVITNETGTGSLVFGTSPTISNANLTGVPTAPTATAGTNTTQVATTAFVAEAVGASGGVSGTGVDNQVAIWSGGSTLEGDSSLTFDTTTDTLSVGESGSFTFGAVTILDDNAGTTTLSNIDALDSVTESTIEAAIDTLTDVSLLGTPTAPTATTGTNTTQVATTAFVQQELSALGGGGLTVAFHNTATLSPSVDTHYIVDTTANAVTVTLPNSPANGVIIGFSDFKGNFGTNNLTINASGTDTVFNGVDTQLVLDSDFQVVELAYWNGNWSVTNAESFVDNGIGGGASGGSGLTPVPVTNAQSPYTANSNELLLVDTTAGSVVINLPASGSDTIVQVSDVSGNAGTNGITINRAGSDTILGDTAMTITDDYASALLSIDSTQTDWKVAGFTLPNGGGSVTGGEDQTVNVISWSSGGTIDYSLGSFFSLNASNTGTLAESNLPANGERYRFEILFTLGSGAAFTKPSSWSKGDAFPTAAGEYYITGITQDGGTSFYIAVMPA